jgi:hypothetical protein
MPKFKQDIYLDWMKFKIKKSLVIFNIYDIEIFFIYIAMHKRIQISKKKIN